VTVVKGLRPVASPDTRIFILGSLPGVRSLAERRYYAHPTNQFWRLMGSAVGVDLQSLGYAERLHLLKAHGIGLWDVIDTAQRDGSADQSIRNHRTNDLAGLRQSFPLLRAIAFNGATASKEGRRLLSGLVAIDLIDLPSSSAANTSPFATKAEVWSAIADYAVRQ
jgi:TDG/mug DNA glycosylase family protein